MPYQQTLDRTLMFAARALLLLAAAAILSACGDGSTTSNSAVSATADETVALKGNVLIGIEPFDGTDTRVLRIKQDQQGALMVSTIGTAGVAGLSGLAVQPGTGVLWATQGFAGGGIFEINRETGAGRLVGQTGFCAVPGVIFDTDGTLYGSAVLDQACPSGSQANGLILIDVRTGEGTVVGPYGPCPEPDVVCAGDQISGMDALAVDPTTGILWGVAHRCGENFPACFNTFFNIDKTTGEATEVGRILPGAEIGTLVGLAFDSAGSLLASGGSGDGRLFYIDKTDVTSFKEVGDATLPRDIGGGGSLSDIAVLPRRQFDCSSGDVDCLINAMYTLLDHPDGNENPPPYGLRLDGIEHYVACSDPTPFNPAPANCLGPTDDAPAIGISDTWTFSFDTATGMTGKFDEAAQTFNIFGRAFGGRKDGNDPGFIDIDFTYFGVTVANLAGGLFLEEGVTDGGGSITFLGDNGDFIVGNTIVNLIAFPRTEDDLIFQFNDDGHRMADHCPPVVLVGDPGCGSRIGRGWLALESFVLPDDPATELGQLFHTSSQDWLFTSKKGY